MPRTVAADPLRPARLVNLPSAELTFNLARQWPPEAVRQKKLTRVAKYKHDFQSRQSASRRPSGLGRSWTRSAVTIDAARALHGHLEPYAVAPHVRFWGDRSPFLTQPISLTPAHDDEGCLRHKAVAH